MIKLSNGESAAGCFFVGGGSARHAGPERVGDLLNAEAGFFPFEIHDDNGTRTVLYNRAHVVTVTVSGDEASRDPGYAVATRRVVSMLLSTGQRLIGAVRVYRPEGQDRLSDWARQPDTFHYLASVSCAISRRWRSSNCAGRGASASSIARSRDQITTSPDQPITQIDQPITSSRDQQLLPTT